METILVLQVATSDSVPPLHWAMRLRKDLLVVVCETFNRMFNHNSLVASVRLSIVDSSKI